MNFFKFQVTGLDSDPLLGSSVADPGCLSRILIYLNFELLKKNIWVNLQRIIELSTQKIDIKLSKYWFGIREPRSGIRKITYPVVKKAPDPDPQHCLEAADPIAFI
jgi:hypothetical protein